MRRPELGAISAAGGKEEPLALFTVDRIQQRDGHRALIDIVGTGQRVRTVPMPAWTKGRGVPGDRVVGLMPRPRKSPPKFQPPVRRLRTHAALALATAGSPAN